MVIYADVLIFTNIIVNYFLLLISAKLDSRQFSSLRIVISSLLGGIFSLYILLDIDNTVLDIVFKCAFCAIMVLVGFGFKNLKAFLRSSFFLLASTFIFSGIMLLICKLYQNDIIVVNNSTVYFDVSCINLILTAAVVYILVTVIMFFTHKKSIQAKFCDISVIIGNKTAHLKGFFDSGNSLTDNFSENAVILVDKNALISQNIPVTDNCYKNRYRILPCKTVAGDTILEGIRADKIILDIDGKKQNFENGLIMFSKTAIKDGYNAILNTEILSQVG